MVAHAGSGWKLAEALIVLEAEANLFAPRRSKASDGSIGDPSHMARTSHHNVDVAGYVTALDLTHDPAGGFDAIEVADLIADRIAAGVETRVVGIGSFNWATGSERWFSQHGGTAWSWQDQDLNGATHRTHMHLEVSPAAYTSTAPWGVYVPQRPATSLNESEIEMEYWRLESGGATHLVGAGRAIPLTGAEKASYDAQRKAKGEPALRTYVVSQRMLDVAAGK